MPQGYPVPLPQRLFDSDGAPANGWKIYTYTAGTTTPLTTYSDGGLSSANTNPIIAGSDGYFRMFVADATYVKIIVKNASDALQFMLDNLEPMQDQAAAAAAATPVPTGGIVAYGAASAPTGYLLCNGALVSRATYSALFTAISTTFGAGDGSTTFGLPDLRGKFPLGVAASGTGNTLGGTGGAIDHVHTGPSHTHVSTIPRDGWGNASNVPATSGRIRTGDAAGTGTEANAVQAANTQDVTSAAGGTGNTGTANPPFLALTFIIKT